MQDSQPAPIPRNIQRAQKYLDNAKTLYTTQTSKAEKARKAAELVETRRRKAEFLIAKTGYSAQIKELTTKIRQFTAATSAATRKADKLSTKLEELNELETKGLAILEHLTAQKNQMEQAFAEAWPEIQHKTGA